MNYNNFKVEDFDSPDLKGSGSKMSTTLLSVLDTCFDYYGKKPVITSGYRTKEYNQGLIDKGYSASMTSSHLKGLAVDVFCDNSTDRFHLIGIFINNGFKRIGIGKDLIHIDLDYDKALEVMWVY